MCFKSPLISGKTDLLVVLNVQVKLAAAFIFTASIYVSVETCVRFAHLVTRLGLTNLSLLQNIPPLNRSSLQERFTGLLMKLCLATVVWRILLSAEEGSASVTGASAPKAKKTPKLIIVKKMRDVCFHIWLFVFQTVLKTPRLKGQISRIEEALLILCKRSLSCSCTGRRRKGAVIDSAASWGINHSLVRSIKLITFLSRNTA